MSASKKHQATSMTAPACSHLTSNSTVLYSVVEEHTNYSWNDTDFLVPNYTKTNEDEYWDLVADDHEFGEDTTNHRDVVRDSGEYSSSYKHDDQMAITC